MFIEDKNPFIEPRYIPFHLKNGGDINVIYQGKSLIQFLLDYDLKDEYLKQEALNMLCNPQCVTNGIAIQDSLISNLSLFRFCFKRSKEDISTFINRFDLSHSLYGHKKVNWLNYFLSSENRFYIFMFFIQYHKNFSKFVRVIDHHNKNIWHKICYSIATKPVCDYNVPLIEKIITHLYSVFPEGLLQRNVEQYTPLELMLNVVPYSSTHFNDINQLIMKIQECDRQQDIKRYSKKVHIIKNS